MDAIADLATDYPLRGTQRRMLLRRGVDPRTLAEPWPLLGLDGVLDGSDPPRFRLLPHVGEPHIGIPIVDADGELVDILAWDPATDRLGTLDGEAFAIGQGLLAVLPRAVPLPVHRLPIDFLRAGRTGLLPVDLHRFAAACGDRVLRPEDEAHRAEIAAAYSAMRPRFAPARPRQTTGGPVIRSASVGTADGAVKDTLLADGPIAVDGVVVPAADPLLA